MIATTPADILRFALDRSREGVGTILVTLTAIEGSSPRAIGAQMAVAEDERYVGSFSGGCIEAAVVAEAIGTLADGRARLVRFGAGSPYLDIRLPCGGGIDLLFNPSPDPDAIAEVLSRHDRREVAVLRLAEDGVFLDAVSEGDGAGWRDEGFRLCYAPTLRVVTIGQGEELTALARLAKSFGADVSVLSPDERALADLTAEGFDTVRLTARTSLPPVRTDVWTAILSVFHDRDWEEELLPLALRLPSFYIGAIGSRRTQDIRLDTLRAAGVPEDLRRKLRTTVGLIPATRDPATLALSALSQIVQEYHRVGGQAVGTETAADDHATSGDFVDQALRA
jgi:xanthine dehydrogenase accessory factor